MTPSPPLQDEIHALLLAFAEAGACVVRLKGGDPYVFGRGGEEVAYLAARGVTVHCAPGITAASGAQGGSHHSFLRFHGHKRARIMSCGVGGAAGGACVEAEGSGAGRRCGVLKASSVGRGPGRV